MIDGKKARGHEKHTFGKRKTDGNTFLIYHLRSNTGRVLGCVHQHFFIEVAK